VERHRQGRCRGPEVQVQEPDVQVQEETAQLTHAVGRGTVLTLIGNGPPPVAPEMFIENAFTMLMRQIVTPAPADPPLPEPPPAVHAATTLRASLSGLSGFTDGGKALMAEWLRRVEGHEAQGAGPVR
jgi:hypothetical protein